MRGLPKFDDPNLVIGTDCFSDAGVYRVGTDQLLVQSVDFFPPLVDDPFIFGQIAAANALSDIFTMGARPITALNIVGFPTKQLDLEVLQRILAGGAERVKAAGAVILGGHTVRDAEVKYGLAVTGLAAPDDLLTNSGAQPGDALILTKALGTGFITTAGKVKKSPPAVTDHAIQSMIQLNSVGLQAARAGKAHAVTDVTGFGLAGHGLEMADAANVALVFQVDQLPDLPGALQLVAAGYRTAASATNRRFLEPRMRMADTIDTTRLELMFDPQTSGGLLMAVPPESVDQALNAARSAGAVSTVVVGHVTRRQDLAIILE